MPQVSKKLVNRCLYSKFTSLLFAIISDETLVNHFIELQKGAYLFMFFQFCFFN